MLDEWWDTEEYRKRFVPYHEKIAKLLLEYYLTRPKRRKKILQSWYDLGEVLEREIGFAWKTDTILRTSKRISRSIRNARKSCKGG